MVENRQKMIKQLMFSHINVPSFIPVKKDLCSKTFTTTYHMICIYQEIPGASQRNPDLVTNSGPILDHFWHLGEASFKKNWFFSEFIQTSETPPPSYQFGWPNCETQPPDSIG